MQTLNHDLWLQQTAELKEDEVGKEFLDFLVDWVDTTEAALEADDQLSPSTALRFCLSVTEERFGRISASFIGQMLVVIISHWIHGHQLSAEFTAIERRLMEDMLIIKLRELQESAALDTEEEVTTEC
jgi:hypothetical protein